MTGPDRDRPDAPRPERGGREDERPDGQRQDPLEEILAEHREPDPETDAAEEDAAAGADPLDPFAGLPGSAAPARGGEAGQTADRDSADGQGGADGADAEPEDTLPDAPLFALLRTVARELDPDAIDRIWVFPPRRLTAGETAVVVVAAFHEREAGRRRIHAAHYTVLEDQPDARLVLQEYGNAPVERVARVVEDVVDRIGDDPAGAPRAHDIGGDPERWHEVLHRLAEAYLEQVARDPRIRR